MNTGNCYNNPPLAAHVELVADHLFGAPVQIQEVFMLVLFSFAFHNPY